MSRKRVAPLAAEAATLRVAVYLRISTDEEHQPYSLEAQEHRLKAFIESQPGWTLARKPYIDQISGAKVERPGLERLLRDAKLGLFDIVLVYRVDRFARSLKILVHLLEELDAAGVAFRSATEPIDTSTPTGRMLVQLLGVFAEFERATIIDRVIAGMERKAARGEWPHGNRPYGYAVDPDTHHLVVRLDEKPVVELIFDLYAIQRLGARKIATELNRRGHRSRSGKLWNHDSVLTVLRNRVYVGEIYFREVWHGAPHERIIDADLFDAAQKLLAERGEDFAVRRTNASDYLATSKLRCGRCERPFVGTRATGNRYTYRYYTCYTRQRFGAEHCPAERLPADELERELLRSMIDTYGQTDLLDEAIGEAWERLQADQANAAAELAKVETELDKTEQAVERYLLAFEAGTLSEQACGQRVNALGARLTELRDRERELAATVDPDRPTAPAETLAAALQDKISLATVANDTTTCKALIQELVETITVNGRDDIVPVYRVPDPDSHEPKVRELSGSVGAAGIEPATARV